MVPQSFLKHKKANQNERLRFMENGLSEVHFPRSEVHRAHGEIKVLLGHSLQLAEKYKVQIFKLSKS